MKTGMRKVRKNGEDRSAAKYSEEDFINMSREKQLAFAKKYLGKNVKEFDDGTFQFSYTHFSNLCTKLGYEKQVIDILEKGIVELEYERDWENNSVIEKKFSLSKETLDEISMFLSIIQDQNVRTKAHIMDAVIKKAFENANKAYRENNLKIVENSKGRKDIL